jgi:sulfur-oxidizing protein SoxB
MNLTKREFFQVLGAGTMAGMGLGTYAEADAATAFPSSAPCPSCT